MKILQVIPNLATGGAEVFVVSLCNALVNLGHEVTLLTFYPKDESQFLYQRLDKRVKTALLSKKPGVDVKLSFRLYNYIRHNEFEVAHFHVQSIIYAIVACLFSRKCKYVATIHNDAFKEADGLHRQVRKFLFRNNLMSPVTISDESRVSFEKLYNLKSTMIYNGVATDYHNSSADISVDRFKITPNTVIFTYVASVNKVKNQLNAAKAFNRLAEEGYDVVLLILGRITDTDYCRKVKNEVSKNVIVYGQADNPLNFMRQSDFFMLVSHYEGMPISLLEAFATQLIPVVTPVGGNKNLVHDGINGIICSGCEVDDICDAVKRALMLTETQRKQMRERLSEAFVDYSIETCANKHINLYNSKGK